MYIGFCYAHTFHLESFPFQLKNPECNNCQFPSETLNVNRGAAISLAQNVSVSLTLLFKDFGFELWSGAKRSRKGQFWNLRFASKFSAGSTWNPGQQSLTVSTGFWQFGLLVNSHPGSRWFVKGGFQKLWNLSLKQGQGYLNSTELYCCFLLMPVFFFLLF